MKQYLKWFLERALVAFAFLLILILAVALSTAYPGTNTIPTRSTGQTISADFFNVLKSTLSGAVVPRNVSGIAADQSGDLGTSDYRWRDMWLSRKVQIGAVADEVSIVGEDASVKIQVDGVTKFQADATGTNGAYFKDSSVPYASFDATARLRTVSYTTAGTYTLTVPSNVSTILMSLCGGGGGGGDGVGGGGGGGGGGGANPLTAAIQVTPGQALTITVGAAGARASVGGATTVYSGATLIARSSGGSKGSNGTSGSSGGGAGASSGFYGALVQAGGGNGGGSAVAGSSGTFSMFADGGTGGTSNEGGGGGGGGASIGAGGAGGAGSGSLGTGASGGTGGQCAGGGGGGGGGANGGTGGAGGAGAARLTWFGAEAS